MSIGDGIISTPDMWAMINNEEMMRNMLAQAQQAGVQSFPHPVSVPTPVAPIALAARAREMFLKRMGGIRAELKLKSGDFVTCHIYLETVHLFYCFDGRSGVATENIDLFPSDQFITQFRLVLT
jgi:hypothetical protein